jgi:hypothetical protein
MFEPSRRRPKCLESRDARTNAAERDDGGHNGRGGGHQHRRAVRGNGATGRRPRADHRGCHCYPEGGADLAAHVDQAASQSLFAVGHALRGRHRGTEGAGGRAVTGEHEADHEKRVALQPKHQG